MLLKNEIFNSSYEKFLIFENKVKKNLRDHIERETCNRLVILFAVEIVEGIEQRLQDDQRNW